MSKALEALERLYCAGRLDLDYVSSPKHKEDYDLIENALKRLEQLEEEKQSFDRAIEKKLKDYEWLKSIIPIDAMFMWNLSSDDKLRLLKIMGVNYE